MERGKGNGKGMGTGDGTGEGEGFPCTLFLLSSFPQDGGFGSLMGSGAPREPDANLTLYA